jgi:Glycosyl hydrolase family 76
MRFVQTGEDRSGGIRWREGLSTRNTCSTAAAAWLAMLTAGSQDRAFAERTLEWLMSTLRLPDGTFADRIDHGVVETTVWSYNQGAAVAALRLAGRTADADATARASIEIFDGDRRWREPPPFLAIWFRALVDQPAIGDRAIRSLREHVDRMLALAQDGDTGLFTRGGIGSYDGRTTIDHAAAIQLLALREATA